MKKSVACLNTNDFKVVRLVSRWYGEFQNGAVLLRLVMRGSLVGGVKPPDLVVTHIISASPIPAIKAEK